MSDPSARLLVFDHDGMEAHDPGWAHVERPARLQAARAAMTGWSGLEFRKTGWVDRDALLAVHRQTYVDWVLSLDGHARQLDPDTVISPGSVSAALLAAGAVVEAVREVCADDAPVRRALCLVRPPGHHAMPDHSMGFCLFNNVAVGAAAALRQGAARVLVVDWDVHHGNGTEAMLGGKPEFLFFSVHQGGPFWPYTGTASSADGTVLNAPLPEGAGHDELVGALRDRLVPAAEAFRPELVLVSAGFDAHADDPLGGLTARDDTYYELARIVRGIADRHADGRLVLALEGGYDLLALGRSLRQVVRALLED